MSNRIEIFKYIENKNLYIFGTGKLAETFLKSNSNLLKKVTCFLDNNEEKWNKTFFNLKIVFPAICLQNDLDSFFIVITSMYYDEIAVQLNKMGLKHKRHFANYTELSDVEQIQYFEPGHYYSPIPNVRELKEREDEIFCKQLSYGMEININSEKQFEFWKELLQYYDEFPYGNNENEQLRYYFNNYYFDKADSYCLYSILRHIKSKRVVEIGSGFSSAVMLDTNQIFLNNSIELTFIEPYPDRLKQLLKEEDLNSCTLIEKNVQSVDKSIFRTLKEGDILFVDSSHVSKTGSDVNYLLFEVLPILNNGVYIHFHDIFYPFEYPERWIYEGRAWNEAYILRAFLQYNDTFEIVLWHDFLVKCHREKFEKYTPSSLSGVGGSIWIRKKVEKDIL